MSKIFLLAVSGLFSFIYFHPIHISVCEIEFDKERKALEITQKIFLDDLEKEIQRENGRSDLVITDLSMEETRTILEQYMLKHVKIYLNGSEKTVQFVGYEFEEQSVYIYTQVLKVKNPSAVGIMNTILLKTYDDQINLVHVEVEGKMKSLKLEGRIFQDEVKF